MTYATTSGSSVLKTITANPDDAIVVGQINYMVDELMDDTYRYTYTLQLNSSADFIAHGVDLVVFGYVEGSLFGFADLSLSHFVPPAPGSPFDPYIHIVFTGNVVADSMSPEFGFISTNSPSSGNITVFDGGNDAMGVTTTGSGGTTGGAGTVPEPGTLLMLASGLLALSGVRRFKNRR